MARRIVITSGKGGVGKTSVATFLGAQLAKWGERVVIVDLDFGLNNLDVQAGVEGKVVYDLVDVVEGRCRAKQAMIQCDNKNLYIVPSAHTFSKHITGQNVRLFIDGLASGFDYVLLDCPAGIDLGFQRAISACNEAIIVLTPTLQSLRDADKVLTILRGYRLDGVGAVINQVRPDLIKKNKQLSTFDIESVLKIPTLASIYSSDDVLLATNCELKKYGIAESCFKKLAKAVKKGAYFGKFGELEEIL